MHSPYILSFNEFPDSSEIPDEFTYPFKYAPHKLCVKAAEIVQKQLNKIKLTEGKMFGVLVVQLDDSLHFLTAYSGYQDLSTSQIPFVPFIYDMYEHDGIYETGSKKLEEYTKEIENLKSSTDLKTCITQIEKLNLQLEKAKNDLKLAKLERKKLREKAGENWNKELENSATQKRVELQKNYKKTREFVTQNINDWTRQKEIILFNIKELENKRKEFSGKVQHQIFDQFQLLSADGEKQSINHIFQRFNNSVPPAGSGDCAAPRLLQFAYENNLKPIAMAEFWWGPSPANSVRKQGHFYPSCRTKCEPILSHMLQGLKVEKPSYYNLESVYSEIRVLYEDEYILGIHKPDKLLSVPGKVNKISVYNYVKNKYPKAEGPLLVHRLDMATSGVLLIAKNKEVYVNLQKQFADRTIKKHYVAILEGTLPQKSGSIDLPLRVDEHNRPQQMVCQENGKKALTYYDVIKHNDKETYVNFYPQTGRTHQLRVHAAHQNGLNAPIKGDSIYGTESDRLYLHAKSIGFRHPITDEEIMIESPSPF